MIRLVTLALVVGYSQSTSAQSVSVTDYDQATSAFDELSINGTIDTGKSRGDDQNAYYLDLGFDYDQVFFSPDRDLRLRASGNGSIERAGGAGSERQSRYDYGISTTIDDYIDPGESKAFRYGSVGIQGIDEFNGRQFTGFVGVGYGRVKNVTPMATAIRVIEELMSRGELTRAPALSVYQEVANIIDLEPTYFSKYGAAEYIEIWIADVANALQTSGQATDKFEAAEIIRIYEILTRERISTRKVGWKLRGGLGYMFRSSNDNSDFDPALELGAEYHYPLSNQTQFSNDAVLTTILVSGDQWYNFRNVMSLTHEIDDRVDWENSWTLTHGMIGPTDATNTVNALSTALIYELRNQLDFTITMTVSNYSGSGAAGTPNGTDTSFFVGLRHRLK